MHEKKTEKGIHLFLKNKLNHFGKKKSFAWIWYLVIILAIFMLGSMLFSNFNRSSKNIDKVKRNLHVVDPQVEYREEETAVTEYGAQKTEALSQVAQSMKQKQKNDHATLQKLQETIASLKTEIKTLEDQKTVGTKIQQTPESSEKQEESIHVSVNTFKPPVQAIDHTPDLKNIVAAGTLAKAVLLMGANVGAGVNSQADQTTMVMRVVSVGRISGENYADIRNCQLVMAARGDISSERVLIRAEKLRCLKDGKLMGGTVDAIVSGPDGIEGVRGKAVFREKEQLQSAFLAGTLGGLAKGISQTMTTPITLADGVRRAVLPKDVLEYSAASGMGDAMSQLAAYHIKRAELYHPVVQLKPGTKVDLLFKKDTVLKIIAKRREKDV